ncbi:MAG: hypothetical protein WCG95_00040 [bacterium]
MSNTVNYTPSTHDGNGITVDFPFDFKAFSASDLIVTIEDTTTGNQTTLNLNANYTVVFNSKTGGSVHIPIAPLTGFKVIISRKVKTTQTSDYKTSPGFDAKEIEKSFDKCAAMSQDLAYDLQRALKVKVGSSVLDLTLPEPDAGKAVKWKADLTGLENSDVDIDEAIIDIAASAASALASQNAATSAAASSATSAANAQSSVTSATAQAAAAAVSAAEAANSAQQVLVSNITFTATIGTTWVGSSAPFTQEVAVSGVLVTDNAIVGLIQSNTYATALIELAEYSKIYKAVSSADKVTFYANAPTTNPITVQIKASR